MTNEVKCDHHHYQMSCLSFPFCTNQILGLEYLKKNIVYILHCIFVLDMTVGTMRENLLSYSQNLVSATVQD